MQNKTIYFVLSLLLWFGASRIDGFFNYKHFQHDFRPDLQEFCPKLYLWKYTASKRELDKNFWLLVQIFLTVTWRMQVKAMRNFDITGMMGFWYIVEYYASSEEAAEYACMQSNFSMSTENAHITMNFTYFFKDDPNKDILYGNITWVVPNSEIQSYWIHAESIYEGIYNTYVIDASYGEFALIMHCAEKPHSNRYFSALMLSREPKLEINVINFLREKLPIYEIDVSFMFPIEQEQCPQTKKTAKNSFHSVPSKTDEFSLAENN